MTPDGPARFTFNPLEKRGVFLGLQLGQLATILAGVLASVVVTPSVPGVARLPVVVALLVGSAGAALWPIAGRPLVSWAPVVSGWLARSSRPASSRISGDPLDGRPGLTARRRRLSSVPGVSVVEVPAEPGSPTFGALRDASIGSWVAVVPVRGSSFSLLGPEEQARRLDAWRAVLGALGRAGNPLHRVQWVERTGPGAAVGLSLPPDTPLSVDGAGATAAQSYRGLVDWAAPALQSHEVWVAVSVGGSRVSRPDRLKGRDALGRELRLLDGQLRSADLAAGRPLQADELETLLGAPMAVREEWDALRVDGDWHATYWVAEWPRVEVTPDFLAPLLVCEGRRSVAVVMSSVPPAVAVRQARSARTADLADAELRSRAGFLSSARRERESDGAVRRECELADGHAEFRFSGYVTVTASDRSGLEVACAEAEHAAQSSRLELRRLYGRQAEAFGWTLPIARGLA